MPPLLSTEFALGPLHQLIISSCFSFQEPSALGIPRLESPHCRPECGGSLSQPRAQQLEGTEMPAGCPPPSKCLVHSGKTPVLLRKQHNLPAFPHLLDPRLWSLSAVLQEALTRARLQLKEADGKDGLERRAAARAACSPRNAARSRSAGGGGLQGPGSPGRPPSLTGTLLSLQPG